MSIAKIKNTQDIVHGKHLKSMTQDEINRTEFVCPYDECEMPAIPCAYKETNKVESYFKYKKHHPECETTHNKKEKHADSEEGQQAPFSTYINELREPSTISAATRNRREASASATQKENSNDGRSSKYIEAVIDYYIEDPSQAKVNLIKLPGSKKSTYQSAFQLITANKDYKGGHIFYCQMSFNEKPYELEGIVTITLLPFTSKEERFKLKLNTQSWSIQKKFAFDLSVGNVLDNARAHYYESKKSPTKYPYIFFFAKDAPNNGCFYVEHYEFFSVRFSDKISLPFNQDGVKGKVGILKSEVSEVLVYTPPNPVNSVLRKLSSKIMQGFGLIKK